ncbi:MAG: peptide chain release factor N(5)-glutamine methyltransferase [Chitinophagaceae bacterium]
MQEATYYLLNKLKTIYDKSEASQITDWVMEKLTGSKKAERMIYKTEAITSEEELLLHQYTERLLKHEPVQYVLNEAWFGNMKFYVDKNVLIPRPETEELVEWVISNCRFPIDELKILDIGSGSGCIPISLKKRIRKAEVWSCDISEGALTVAKKNTEDLGQEVNFIHLDFLDQHSWTQLPKFDIIVSNPPYIPENDKQTMQRNVLQYEPATALFVPNNDPLLFYKAIAAFGKEHLEKDGSIFMEIHESLGKEVTQLFHQAGYSTEIKKDMQEKDRMIKASLV